MTRRTTREVRIRAALVLLTCLSVLVSSAAAAPPRSSLTATSAARPCGTTHTPPSTYGHVVWILMENTSYPQVIGSADAPYLTSLARRCGVATNYSAIAHPSLPNYIALTSGSTQGITDDADPAAHPLAARSIFAQLGSGWRVLAEGMPTNCALSNARLYAVRHNPATYYTKVRARCEQQDVSLTGAPDISARFTLIVPNLCHDMHNCSTHTGDGWLAGFVPKLLNSAAYRSGTTAVFVTWDEGSGDNHVATLVISPSTPRGVQAAQPFDHYSLLRTTEDLLGLRGHLAAAASAAGMRTAFHL